MPDATPVTTSESSALSFGVTCMTSRTPSFFTNMSSQTLQNQSPLGSVARS